MTKGICELCGEARELWLTTRMCDLCNDYLNKRNANYPSILNILGQRNISSFFADARRERRIDRARQANYRAHTDGAVWHARGFVRRDLVAALARVGFSPPFADHVARIFKIFFAFVVSESLAVNRVHAAQNRLIFIRIIF